jgi:hypothetical protein
MKVQQILDLIDAHDMALPEFQRGYVWNREQVRGFFSSLYQGYPIGGFLVWHTEAGGTAQRGVGHLDGKVKLLLDGQQRATSLYGVIRGKAPEFFEGNEQAFTGLHFNVTDEVFEFYAPTKMKSDPAWIDVSHLMEHGLAPYIAQAGTVAGPDKTAEIISRLNQVMTIKDKEIHLEDVTGTDKTIDVVVDIFNRVNSGGTKLSKGDLALAQVCARWPEARQAMNAVLAEWRKAGFDFSLDWLMRVVNAVATGKAPFNALESVTATDFEQALTSARKYVSAWLDVIAGRLGLDHDRVLFGRFAVVVLARHMHLNGGQLPDAQEQDKLLYWFANAGMWGRYAGSTESVLTQDLDGVESGGVKKLIDILRLWRGGLTVRPDDFAGNSMGARFYPTLYMLTRTMGARDFDSGVVLSKAMLGHLSTLEVHHVFPKARLYEKGYERGDVNALANFCFLTKGSNLKISATEPAAYMPEVEQKLPGALASQWIPMDAELWTLDRYLDFLEARRRLLADAANVFLDSLLAGELPEADSARASTSGPAVMEEATVDERSVAVGEMVTQLRAAGFAVPERDVEVAHPETGRVLSIAEAYWPEGLQPGLGQPVVLELDEDDFDENALAALGFLVFTSIDALMDHAAGVAGTEVVDATRREQDSSTGVPDAGASDDRTALREGNDLLAAFNLAMRDVYVRAKNEAGYNATVYLRMLADHGGMGTARRLLASTGVSEGFVALWERGRIDLAVENVVLRPEFASLFTDDELEVARQRLRDYGFDVA